MVSPSFSRREPASPRALALPLRLPLGRVLATCAVAVTLASGTQTALAEHAPPPPMPVFDRQAPERAADPLVRRPVEFHAGGTTSWLGCSGSAPRSLDVGDPCAHLGAGYGLEGSILYRPFPSASLGPTVNVTQFSWDPSRVFSGAPAQGRARWTSVGLTGRASFVDEGRFDPFLSAFAGFGFLRMDGDLDRRLTRTGFLTRAAVGLDVWITGRWKLTSRVEAAWQPGSGAERCEGGSCLDGAGLARIPGRSLGAGVGLAWAVGDAL
jgi:hypothetical protein